MSMTPAPTSVRRTDAILALIDQTLDSVTVTTTSRSRAHELAARARDRRWDNGEIEFAEDGAMVPAQ